MEGKKSTIDNTGLVIDRISSLPDFILGHILSFLPTKEAVAAAVLSKRWKFAWVTVHDLDFCFVDSCEGRSSNDQNMKFVQFVNRVLLLHDGGSLNKFSLDWHVCTIASYVSSWINIAITRNVHELYLSLGDGGIFYIPISGFNCDSLQSLELNEVSFVCGATSVFLPRLQKLKLVRVDFENTEACGKLISGCPMLRYLYLDIYYVDDCEVEELDMPLSVFTCESLQSLELEGNISVPAAIAVCLPRLEKLKLDHVNFESKEACEKLISGCPMLEYLDIGFFSFTGNGDDDDDDYFTCIISSASLRHLKIYFKKKSSLKLKASSLESFEVSGCISEIYVEKSLRSLVQADFSVTLDGHDFSNNSIVEAVRAFDCAKVLTLSTDIMWALSHATISLSTEFKRLVKLEAECYCSSLQDVIQSSDNLEDLIIYQLSIDDVHGHSKWTTPVEVPRCLSNSLKKVQLCDYKGLEDEREMIRYMLKHGSALEVMRISCYIKGDGEKLKLLQDISEFPRKSPVCKVQFSK